MKHLRNASWCLALVGIGALSVQASLRQQAQAPAPKAQTSQNQTPPQKKDSANAPMSRVTIEVSGGQDDTAVENASVYFKYIEERKIRKDKQLELNVKTNREGTAHVPDAPFGRVLIQVVADGWKPYGRWYDISEAKQTIKVHLDKPPHWY
jgi:hypothetical protein